MSIVFVVVHLIDDGWNEFKTSGADNGEIVTNITYFQLNIFVAFGIVGCIYSGFILMHLYNQKKAFLKMSALAAGKHAAGTNEVIIQLNDEEVIYQDSNCKQELKWNLFSEYALYKHYIFLIVGGAPIASIVIDRRLISESEATELISFLKQRFTERKY